MDSITKKPTGKAFLTNQDAYFNVDKINAKTIMQYSVNPYYDTKKSRLSHQIFNGPPKIEIFTPDYELDEELTDRAYKMCENLADWNTKDKRGKTNIYQIAQQAFSDIFDGGASLLEPIWVKNESFINLHALNRLPWDTFKDLPDSYDTSPSIILKGVLVNTKGEMEYWQYQDDGKYHKIDNILHIKRPTSRDLAGDALCIPIIPVIIILDYLWDILRRKMGRVGIPSIFIETQSGDDETQNFADKILRDWGNDIQFKHNPNIRVYTLDFDDSADVEGAIRQAEEILDHIYNPTQLVEKSGTVVGGSDAGAERLINAQGNTMLTWLDAGFTSLLQQWLDMNGFEGYTASIEFPKSEKDETATKLLIAKAGYETKTLTITEIRELLPGIAPTDDEILTTLEEQYSKNTPSFEGFQNSAPVRQNLTKSSISEKIEEKVEKELLDVESQFEKRILEAVGL